MQEAAYFYRQLNLFEICEEEQTANAPAFLYGRTSPAPFPQTGEWTFSPSLKKSGRPNFQYLKMENGRTPEWLNCQDVKSRGECLTRNIGESPNEEKESSLSQILQEEVPEKYYLSAKACEGVLRRAEKRGKDLPPELKAALEAQASCECVPDAPGGGKGALVSREKSLSLLNHNEQVLFVPDKARSLTARNDGSPCVDRGPDVVAVYDMTHADEVMRPVEGGKCQTLNARMGTGGNQVPVLAFREGSFGQYEKTDVGGTTKAVGGVLGGGSETFVCGGEDNATEGSKILCILREAYGEEKVEDWCFAILARIQSAEILRQRVHEESISSETAQRDELDDDSLPCAEFVAKWLLRDLREREECGRTPQGRESAEQRDNELDEGVQELSHKTPPSAKEMCDLWRQAQGTRLLREALAAFQEIRESVNVKSWGPIKTVRRLTPLEVERLQGLPDGYTLIDDKTCSDTARYKALGNGMAQPCADWIIKRIAEVSA